MYEPILRAGAGAAAAAGDCFHCGLPLPAEGGFGFAHGGEWRAFCCAGCEAISRAISGQGLDGYYGLREAAAPRPEPDPPDEDLALYDDPLVQERFVRDAPGGTREAAVLVEGQRCAACAWLIEQVVARLPGVASAQANFAARRVLVRWDPAAARLSQVLGAIRGLGYAAWPYEEKRLAQVEQRERRALLRRLWVAGLGMMQVMMYALPAWIAGDGDMSADAETLLRWAGLVLTVPVIGYSAAPYFAGAWRSLRRARLGMDVPVALGIGTAFAASVVATLRGSGAVYFDSVAMFVFLLTLGRWLELVARSRAGLALQRLARVQPQFARRLREDAGLEGDNVPVASLVPGERVLVRSGETLPADGTLESEAATLNEALLTGESAPVAKSRGAALLGGSVNAASAFVLRVTRVGAQTALSRIERLMERALAERPRWVEAAQRASGAFVAAVLACALGAGIAWLWIDPARALWVAVSVLIVTCPCALSLATPVAVTVGLGELARGRLVVTRARAIEALAAATDFVFDKTGTLTAGAPRVVEVLAFGVDRARAIACAGALAAPSSHPLDRALAAEAAGLRLPAVADHASHPGEGIEARIAGRRVRLGRAGFAAALHGLAPPVAWLHPHETVVWLADEQGWIAAFRLGDALREDAGAAVAGLRALGLTVHLLTGDEPRVAEAVATTLGIGHVQARASPEGKREYVRALQAHGARVAMVGDGINDAPVLAQADVSIAMGEGADLARLRADAVLVSGALADLPRALRTARATRRVIRQNLGWALGYNLAVLPLAFAGLVTPLLAGVGMASSSLLVVANALRLRR